MIRRTLFPVLAGGVLLAAIGLSSAVRGGTVSPPAAQRSGAGGEDRSSTATGIVSQVSCAGELKIQLDTPEGTRTLRKQPGTHLRITAHAREEENIDPCTSLKGLHVTVRFIPDDVKQVTGTMERIEILPPEAPANSILAASEPHKEAAPKGPLMVATTSEGTVKEVHCDGKDLRITFVVRDVEFKLHARDYTRLDIDEGTALQTRTYDPCTKLSGHGATVTYVLVEKKPYDGEMQAIAVVP